MERDLVLSNGPPTGEYFIRERSKFPECRRRGHYIDAGLSKTGRRTRHAARIHDENDAADAMLMEDLRAKNGVLMSGSRALLSPDQIGGDSGSLEQ
jgi:hypothetical protein